jgi:heme o synthase
MRGNKGFFKLSVLFDLVKIRLSLAIVLSSVTGYLLSSLKISSGFLFMTAGILLISSGSIALNQYSEREYDSKMERTRKRPIPSGRIDACRALWISLLLIIAGSVLLMFAGSISLLIALGNVFLYNFIYTGLKKRTIFAIIPGAFVGAIPPLIGYSSSGATCLNNTIPAFFLFMLLWQLPHFMLIQISYSKDYRVAGFPTILDYATEKKVRFFIFIWLVFTGLLLIAFGLLAFGRYLVYPLILINGTFIILLFRSLFIKTTLRTAFLLVNSFGFLAIIFFITGKLTG